MTENEKIVYVPMSPGMESCHDDDEIDLLELWDILWSGKWFVMAFTLACTLVAVYVTLFVMPVIYKSDAVILPNKSESGASRLSGLVGSLPIPISLPGGGGEFDKVASFLNSRTLQTRLIEKYDLLRRYYPEAWEDEEAEKPTLVKALQTGLIKNILNINNDDKTGLITISWSDQSPEFAALMVERVIAELKFFLENRSSPARTKICLLTIIASGMFSVFLVFGYRFVVNVKKSRKTSEKSAT
jgi:uncharacterized protein involved in exopolysaccharide biosynthesis